MAFNQEVLFFKPYYTIFQGDAVYTWEFFNRLIILFVCFNSNMIYYQVWLLSFKKIVF